MNDLVTVIQTIFSYHGRQIINWISYGVSIRMNSSTCLTNRMISRDISRRNNFFCSCMTIQDCTFCNRHFTSPAAHFRVSSNAVPARFSEGYVFSRTFTVSSASSSAHKITAFLGCSFMRSIRDKISSSSFENKICLLAFILFSSKYLHSMGYHMQFYLTECPLLQYFPLQ